MQLHTVVICGPPAFHPTVGRPAPPPAPPVADAVAAVAAVAAAVAAAAAAAAASAVAHAASSALRRPYVKLCLRFRYEVIESSSLSMCSHGCWLSSERSQFEPTRAALVTSTKRRAGAGIGIAVVADVAGSSEQPTSGGSGGAGGGGSAGRGGSVAPPREAAPIKKHLPANASFDTCCHTYDMHDASWECSVAAVH